MHTPIKPKPHKLNGSFSSFTSPAISKVSTACDLLREERNSNSKKRFARKREASNESLKKIKPLGFQCQGYNNQQQFGQQNDAEFSGKRGKVIHELIFKKNTILPSKYLKICTDRSQNNDNYPPNNDFFHNGVVTTRDHTIKAQFSTIQAGISDYKIQLQLKSSEFIILEDENGRIRKDQIQQLQRQNQRLSQQIQRMRAHQQERIQQLQRELRRKDQQLVIKAQLIQRMEQMLATANTNLKQSANEMQLLKAHLQHIIAQNLSKQALQLVSYRQLSLNNQLLQLRNDFQQLKTQQHKILQIQLNKITQKLSLVAKDRQNLSIANRILNKKNKQIQMAVEKKYKGELAEIKERVRNLVKETAGLKKENVSLRKTIHMHGKKNDFQKEHSSNQGVTKRPNRLLNNGCKKHEQTAKQMDSDDSFTMSLSK